MHSVKRNSKQNSCVINATISFRFVTFESVVETVAQITMWYDDSDDDDDDEQWHTTECLWFK